MLGCVEFWFAWFFQSRRRRCCINRGSYFLFHFVHFACLALSQKLAFFVLLLEPQLLGRFHLLLYIIMMVLVLRNGNKKSRVEVPRGWPIVYPVRLQLRLKILLVHWKSLSLGLQVLRHVMLDVLRGQIHLHVRAGWTVVVHVIGCRHLHWGLVDDWWVLDLLSGNVILRIVGLEVWWGLESHLLLLLVLLLKLLDLLRSRALLNWLV